MYLLRLLERWSVNQLPIFLDVDMGHACGTRVSVNFYP